MPDLYKSVPSLTYLTHFNTFLHSLQSRAILLQHYHHQPQRGWSSVPRRASGAAAPPPRDCLQADPLSLCWCRRRRR